MAKNDCIVAGVGIGAATAQAVVLKNNTIIAFSIIPTGFSAAGAGDSVTKEALEKAGLSMGDVEYI